MTVHSYILPFYSFPSYQYGFRCVQYGKISQKLNLYDYENKQNFYQNERNTQHNDIIIRSIF